jgi:hypothetical protein
MRLLPQAPGQFSAAERDGGLQARARLHPGQIHHGSRTAGPCRRTRPDRPDRYSDNQPPATLAEDTDRRFACALGLRCVIGEYRSDRRQREFCLTAVAARQNCSSRCPLPGGARDVGGDDVSGVPVQAAAGPVIPHRGPRIGMRGGLLHVAQRDPGIQRGGDERMPSVRSRRVRRISVAVGLPSRRLTRLTGFREKRQRGRAGRFRGPQVRLPADDGHGNTDIKQREHVSACGA